MSIDFEDDFLGGNSTPANKTSGKQAPKNDEFDLDPFADNDGPEPDFSGSVDFSEDDGSDGPVFRDGKRPPNEFDELDIQGDEEEVIGAGQILSIPGQGRNDDQEEVEEQVAEEGEEEQVEETPQSFIKKHMFTLLIGGAALLIGGGLFLPSLLTGDTPAPAPSAPAFAQQEAPASPPVRKQGNAAVQPGLNAEAPQVTLPPSQPNLNAQPIQVNPEAPVVRRQGNLPQNLNTDPSGLNAGVPAGIVAGGAPMVAQAPTMPGMSPVNQGNPVNPGNPMMGGNEPSSPVVTSEAPVATQAPSAPVAETPNLGGGNTTDANYLNAQFAELNTALANLSQSVSNADSRSQELETKMQNLFTSLDYLNNEFQKLQQAKVEAPKVEEKKPAANADEVSALKRRIAGLERRLKEVEEQPVIQPPSYQNRQATPSAPSANLTRSNPSPAPAVAPAKKSLKGYDLAGVTANEDGTVAFVNNGSQIKKVIVGSVVDEKAGRVVSINRVGGHWVIETEKGLIRAN